MLGWLLLGALLTAAVVTIVVSYLSRSKAKDELRNRNIQKGVVKSIVRSGSVNHIKMDCLKEDGEEVEVDFEADDYDEDEFYEYAVIYT